MVIKLHKIFQQTLLLSGLLLSILPLQAKADSLSEQRIRYQQTRLAWDSNQQDDVQRLMPTLKTYPLYPYLEYRQISQDLSKLTIKDVNAFVRAHPTLPLSSTLSRNFATELARRGDWKGLVQFVESEPKALNARCQYRYAHWMVEKKKQKLNEVTDLWLSGRSLPAECDALFSVWRSAGYQTDDLVLQRVLLAAQAGKESRGLAGYLVKQLPDSKRELAEAVIQLQDKPAELENFAKQYPVTEFTQHVVLTTFSSLARQNISVARASVPTLVKYQKLNAEQRVVLEKSIASRLMTNSVSNNDAEWRDTIIEKSRDVALIERRIRLALNSGNDKHLAKWLAELPSEAQQKEEWRYWRASLLLKNKSKRAEGEQILQHLMKGRGFYPMVAAQKLNKPYIIQVHKADGENKANKKILKSAELARVEELLYWNLDNQARSEWIRFVAQSNQPEQELLARYAFDKGWADLSVQATITGKLWNHLEERFPVAYPAFFTSALQDKSISTSFAMAIARQESAWNPQVQSPVGATGLMQLMPNTAKETARVNKMLAYKNVSQLLDPQTNIQLGTHYLEYVYQTFDHNRILAAAAYNAGPHRVNSWLAGSGGRIDVIAFIESIPFTETRNYVKNVLSYDVFYGRFIQQESEVLNKNERERRY